MMLLLQMMPQLMELDAEAENFFLNNYEEPAISTPKFDMISKRYRDKYGDHSANQIEEVSLFVAAHYYPATLFYVDNIDIPVIVCELEFKRPFSTDRGAAARC